MVTKTGWALLLSVPLLTAQGAGVVEGVVVNAATSAPVAGVTVELTRAEAGQGSTKLAYRAITDARGTFRLEGVKEGEYTAAFEKPGFMDLPENHPAARPFRITTLSDHARLKAELTPYGKISGLLVDGERRPLQGVEVQLAFQEYGRPHMSVKSDQSGQFVFHDVEPGSYLLVARARPFGIIDGEMRLLKSSLPSPPPAEGQRVEWVPTYSPGVTDYRLATPILVGGGQDLRGFELRLRALPVHRLRGIVRDEQGRPASRVPVRLAATYGFGLAEELTESADDGSFEFDSVREGEWGLRAELPQKEKTRLKGFAEAAVFRSDIDGVEIQLAAAFSLEGRAELEGSRDSERKMEMPSLRLIPADGRAERGSFAWARWAFQH